MLIRRNAQVGRHYVPQFAEEFRPTQLNDVVLWLRADLGITLGATLKAAGTTPPVLTISGTLAQPVGLHIRCSLAGALGVWKYDWSIDNGATYVQTGVTSAAGPTALGTTGVSLSIAAGNASLDNTWDATVSAWADQSIGGHTVTQATASLQPIYIVSATNGKPALRFDGVDDFMDSANFSYAQKLDVSLAMKMISYGASGVHDGVFDCDAAATVALLQNNVNGALFAGVSLTTTQLANGVYAIVSCVCNGIGSSVRSNGSVITSGDAGTNSGTKISVGSLSGGARTTNVEVAEMVIEASANLQLARIESYMRNRYATP